MDQVSPAAEQGLYEAFVQNLKENEDERVKDWLLMDSFWRMVAISTFYVIACKYIGPAIMKDRRPFSLKTTILVYNTVQIICCSVLCYQIISEGLWVAVKLVCDQEEFNNIRICEVSHWMLFVKMLELIETVFFVMRKKQSQVSNLHLYHHATTFVFLWLGIKYRAGLGMSTFLLMNSIIHIIMYSYYTLAAVGSAETQKRIKPFKPYITISQMVQFTIILLLIVRYVVAGCAKPWVLAILFFPNVVVVYWMFYDFYSTVYKVKEH